MASNHGQHCPNTERPEAEVYDVKPSEIPSSPDPLPAWWEYQCMECRLLGQAVPECPDCIALNLYELGPPDGPCFDQGVIS